MSLAQIRGGLRSERRRATSFGPGPQPLGTPVDLTGQATYYVDSVGGLNTNNGTSPSTPKQTLAGLPALAAGNVVALKCGSTFRENVTLTVSGTSGAPILFGQYGTGTRPKLKASKDYGTALSWTLNSGSIYQATATAMPTGNKGCFVDETQILRKYSSLANLQAGSPGGYFADTTNNILYVWMLDSGSPAGHNIEVDSFVAWPVQVQGDYVIFQDVAVIHGVFYSATTHPGVICRRNLIGPVAGTAVYCGSPGMIVEDCLITGAWDGWEYNTVVSAGYGVQIGTANTSGAVVRRNWVTNSRNGIFINGATAGVDIHHNFVYLNHVNGIDNFTAAGTKNIRVMNNTVWHRPTGPTPAGHGIDQQNTGTGLWAMNNIVYTDFTTVGASNIEAYTLASGSSANTAEDYNLGWVVPASTGVFGKVGVTTYADAASYWAAVRTSYGAINDVHSLSANPLFVSLGNLDPRLQPGSPAINAGVVISGITDGYLGAAPDLGAFEAA